MGRVGLTLALLVAGGTGEQLVDEAGVVLTGLGVVPLLVVRSLLGVAWRSQDVS